MPEKRSRFIKVDDLFPQVSIEQAAAFYGVTLPELHRTGDEIRTRCFLNCGKREETGDRALVIKADLPEKKWHCHQFLSSEVCQKWRCGYLPRDTGGDRAGGTMRGKVVYPMLADGGQVLTWFGRDPEFEGKRGKWIVAGRQSRRKPFRQDVRRTQW